ncbi:SDR family oxidoreductase [Yoonia sp.]|uniref:SDR family oxidoreductase n=1 Tax=Yoonia sp. TaxID=2212373 RepID=UPI0035C87D5C
MTSSIPLRRFGTIQDVASTCLFLGSDAASYTNGAIVSSDGGWTVNGAKLA